MDNQTTYIFVDETGRLPEILRFVCIAVRQNYWSGDAISVAAEACQGKHKRALLEDRLARDDYCTIITDLEVNKAEEALSTFGVAAQADSISLRDTLWVLGFGYSVGYAVRRAGQAWALTTCDVFYDSKSLPAAHDEPLRGTIREAVQYRAAEEIARINSTLSEALKIRKIEAIPKQKGRAAYSELQQGTWLADWAGRPGLGESGKMPSGFLYKDLTPILVAASEEWSGRRNSHGV